MSPNLLAVRTLVPFVRLQKDNAIGVGSQPERLPEIKGRRFESSQASHDPPRIS